MKFTCDRCDAQYMISDDKVGPNGVKVRCKKCSHVILVRRAEDGAVSPEVPAAAAAAAPSGEGLDAELGHAFDNAFGGPGAANGAAAAGAGAAADGASGSAAAPGADLDSTQAVSPEEAARLAARSAPPEPAATEWYVAIGQAQVGPLPLAEVRRKWEAGDVGPDSLVWRPGMGDWAPLNGVSDLAAYLAPVPRGAARPRPAQTPAPGARTAAAMPAAAAAPQPRAEVSWKPSGASALAALASEELSAQPDAQLEARPAVTARSLMEGLPDGGGVDPTGAIPLQIKALEETGEQPAKSSVARGAERLRRKRSSTRALVSVIVVLLLALGGGAGYVFKDRLLAAVGSPPKVAQALPSDKPTAAAPAPVQPKPAEPVAPASPATASPTPAVVGAGAGPADAKPAEPKPAEPKAEAPKVAEAKPEPKPAAVAKEPEKPKHEPARTAHEHEKKPVARTARAEAPAPTPAPARKKGDLLDFDGGNDAALDEALGKGGSGRSVYVPPAPGGGDGVPERVTDSQVNETIMTRVSALQSCLTDKGGGGGGVLKLRWSIAPDGGVQNLKSITPESAGTPFAQCVSGVIKGLRFPKTQQGRQDVTFPFKF